MPIGKNSIKRVKNNGYSNVASKAPDMENSTVIVPDAQTLALVEDMVASTEKKNAKKPSVSKKQSDKEEKKASAEKMQKAPAKAKAKKSGEKSQDAKSEVSVEKTVDTGDKTYVNLGEKMPSYLL